MKVSDLDTDIWKADNELLRKQEHVDKVWKIIEPLANDSIEEYLGESSTLLGHPFSKDIFTASKKRIIDGNEKLYKEYHALFCEKNMEEYDEDCEGFKDIIKKECDLIRKCLNTKAEVMKEWRNSFLTGSARALFDTFNNLIDFGKAYDEKITEDAISSLNLVEDCEVSEMGDNSCYLGNVIGYGIASNILNHMYPRVFPGNYRNGLWSLYFLSKPAHEYMPSGTSEFCMIKDNSILPSGTMVVEHNYFFPYEVFYIYTIRMYRLLVNQIKSHFKQDFPSDFRFLLTNDFYDFTCKKNKDELASLTGNDDIFRYNIQW